jgi:hypothetical protein
MCSAPVGEGAKRTRTDIVVKIQRMKRGFLAAPQRLFKFWFLGSFSPEIKIGTSAKYFFNKKNNLNLLTRF